MKEKSLRIGFTVLAVVLVFWGMKDAGFLDFYYHPSVAKNTAPPVPAPMLAVATAAASAAALEPTPHPSSSLYTLDQVRKGKACDDTTIPTAYEFGGEVATPWLLKDVYDNDGTPKRWMAQHAAVVLGRPNGNKAHLLVVDATTEQKFINEIAKDKPQIITIKVNGVKISAEKLPPGDRERLIDVVVPDSVFGKCRHAVLVEFDAAYNYPGGGQANAHNTEVRHLSWGAKSITLKADGTP